MQIREYLSQMVTFHSSSKTINAALLFPVSTFTPFSLSFFLRRAGVIRCYADRTPQGDDASPMHLQRGDRTREGDDLRTQQQHGSPAFRLPVRERQTITLLLSDQAVELLPEFFDLFVCQPIDEIKEFCIERFSRLYEGDNVIANGSGGNLILFVNPFGLCMF